MTEGLLDRYFRLLAGQLPAAEYGVIAETTTDADTTANGARPMPDLECLC